MCAAGVARGPYFYGSKFTILIHLVGQSVRPKEIFTLTWLGRDRFAEYKISELVFGYEREVRK